MISTEVFQIFSSNLEIKTSQRPVPSENGLQKFSLHCLQVCMVVPLLHHIHTIILQNNVSKVIVQILTKEIVFIIAVIILKIFTQSYCLDALTNIFMFYNCFFS